MDIFSLPISTIVNQTIPKSAFDKRADSKLKKFLSNDIQKITWLNKLSFDTINLPGDQIKEIQIIRIELKQRKDVADGLKGFQQISPYHIIFVIQHAEVCYLSTSAKHPRPNEENSSVIDWTFSSDWFLLKDLVYNIKLTESLDKTYLNFCLLLSGFSEHSFVSMEKLIEHISLIDTLRKEITRIKTKISGTEQFKYKVELNVRLRALEKQFEKLLLSP